MSFCILGDCNKYECHHCFPVRNCSKNHTFCNENGICEEIIEIDINNTTILITGSCGFIGFHLSKKLLENGYKVIGIDNLNNYIYDSSLKKITKIYL